MAQNQARFTQESVEHLRRQLPLQVYLSLLHAGAVSGSIPKLDSVTLRPTDEDPSKLSPKVRVELLQSLVNKLMPDVAPKDLDYVANPPKTIEDMAVLTDDQLRQLASKQNALSQELSGLPQVPVSDGETPFQRELASRLSS